MLIKTIKVGEGYYTPPKRNQFKRDIVPAIKLNGKYLKNLGFDVNDLVEISSPENGLLEIRKV